MTIDQLIARLEAYRHELGGETEVRLMTQAHYPWENGIDGLVSGEEINAEDEPEDEDMDQDDVVYICEGQQLGSGSRRAWTIAY